MGRAFRWPHPGVRAWYSLTALVNVNAEMSQPFVSILITALAHGSGLQGPDYTQPCDFADPSDAAALLCRVRIFNRWIAPGSIFLWLRSVSSILNLIVLTPLGPIADQRKYRYGILFSSVAMIFLTATLILPLPSRASPFVLWMSTALVVLQNAAMGLYLTLSSALLREVAQADVARDHGKDIMVSQPGTPMPASPAAHVAGSPSLPQSPKSVHDLNIHDPDRLLASESTPLLAGKSPSSTMPAAVEAEAELGLTISRLCTRADAIGSFLALIVLLGGAGLFRRIKADDIPSLKLAIGIPGLVCLPIGAWCVRGLRSIARHEVAKETVAATIERGEIEASPEDLDEKKQVRWHEGFSKIWHMLSIRNLRELSSLYGLMGVLVIIWDALSVQGDVLTIVFITRLGATPSDMMMCSSLSLGCNTLWAAFAPAVQRRTRASNKQMMIVALVVSTLPCVYGTGGMLLGGRWGYKRKIDYAVAIIPLSVGYSTFYNYSRGLMAELIPEGHESSFFTLSGFFRRGTSFIGPLIVGGLTNRTGNIEWAWPVIGVSMLLSIVISASINVERGLEQRKAWTGP